jgi:hypothetical protein
MHLTAPNYDLKGLLDENCTLPLFFSTPLIHLHTVITLRIAALHCVLCRVLFYVHMGPVSELIFVQF